MGAMIAGGLATVALAAGAVVVGLGINAVKAAGDFQVQMTKLYTTAGESKGNLKMVGDGILAMSGQVGTGAKELGDAMYWIESGGFHGAAGLEVLKIAAMGAKAENAPLVPVANSLTSALNAYAGTGLTAAAAMNTLIAATAAGKMTLNDLSGAVSNVLPATAKFHISLIDTTSAIATMTMQGDGAASAATHLRQMIIALESPTKAGAKALASIGLTTAQVAAEMKVSLPDALKMITDHLKNKFPEGSVAYNQAVKNIAGGSKQMMGFLELTGTHMKAFEGNVASVTDAVHKGGNSIMGWADVQNNFNFKIDQARALVGELMIRIGTQLLPVLTKLLGAVIPIISAFSDWVLNGGVLSGMISDVSAAIGGFASLVTGAFGFMQQQTSASTLQMKVDTINHSLEAARGTVANIQYQRQAVEQEMQHSASDQQRAMLQMKLDALNTSLSQAQGVVTNYTTQRTGIEQQLSMATSANALHTLQDKATSVNTSLSQAKGVVANYIMQRTDLEIELQHTSSAVGRHMIEMKISSINTAIQHAQGVVAAFTKQKTEVGTQVDAMKAKVNADNNNLVLQTINVFNNMKTSVINAFSAMTGSAFFMQNRMEIVIPIIAGVAAAIMATLVPAVWSLAAGVIVATWPVLAIFAAVALLVGGFMLLYNNVKPVRDAIAAMGQAAVALWGILSANLMPILHQIGSFLSSAFTPVWKQLVNLWQVQLMPLFAQISAAFKQMTPLFQLLGIIIGTVVVVAFGNLMGIINGVINAIAGFVSGLINIIGGMVEMFTGAFQALGGVVQFFVDLFTGHFDRLGGDLRQIVTGIINIFKGMWAIIAGIFQTAWYTISGLVTGFVSGIIGFFTNLFNALIGHSIIPDLINGIVTFFTGLPAQVFTVVGNFVTGLIDAFGGMIMKVLSAIGNFVLGAVKFFLDMEWKVVSAVVSMQKKIIDTYAPWIATILGKINDFIASFIAFFTNMKPGALNAVQNVISAITGAINNFVNGAAQFGTTLMKNFASGITGGLGGLKSAVSNAVGIIGNFLPHSPAKEGELKHLDEYGPTIMTALSKGMESGLPTLRATMTHVMQPMAALGTSGRGVGIPSSFQLPAMQATTQATDPNAGRPIILQLDGRQVATLLLPHQATAMRYAIGVTGR